MTSPPLIPALSVVLPCFNAGAEVTETIRAVVRLAARLSDEYEVIVVDDGSTDGTAAIVGRAMRLDPRVRLIVHAGHRGYGAALRSGVRAAGKERVLLTDGNPRIDLRAADDFLAAARRSDLVVGWRVMRRDAVPERARAAAWNRLVRRLFGLTIHDPDCPLKLARRDLLESLELTATAGMVGTEILVKSLAAGARVSQVPFRESPRDARETADSPGVARSVAELTKLYPPLRRLRRGPRDTNPPRRAPAEAPIRLRLREP